MIRERFPGVQTIKQKLDIDSENSKNIRYVLNYLYGTNYTAKTY